MPERYQKCRELLNGLACVTPLSAMDIGPVPPMLRADIGMYDRELKRFAEECAAIYGIPAEKADAIRRKHTWKLKAFRVFDAVGMGLKLAAVQGVVMPYCRKAAEAVLDEIAGVR